MSAYRRQTSVEHGHTSVTQDADALAKLGHKQELQRNFSMLSMLGLAFSILNTWTALAVSLNLALPSGGPSAVLWGLIVAGVFDLCLAASLAEFLSAYPTAAAQYHWAAIVSPRSISRGVSWITGWICVSGWIALTAVGGLLGSQQILGCISLFQPEFEAQRWQQFLLYIAFTLVALLVNVFFTRLLPLFNQAAFYWSILGFVVISITVLATASPDYQPASFVYGGFVNGVGWPDGLAWLLGLLQGALALTAFDATAHMIEEIPEPHLHGPKILIYCVLMGMGTGWVFLSCLMFVIRDIEEVNTSSMGPLLVILYQATNSKVGAICLLIFPLGCLLFATTATMSTSSRMTYAFARDRGLPFSRILAKVHPTLHTPLNALILTTVLVVIFGCIFLGSTSAFFAIVAASVIALGLTYGIPPAINLLRGRKMLPPDRAFVLPGPLGWICNIAGVLWTILTTVLFVFPPATPVTGTSMNYAIVAFAIVLIVSAIQWVVDGRKNYRGPHVDIDGLAIGDAATVDGTKLNSHGSAVVGMDGRYPKAELVGEKRPTEPSGETHAKLH